MLNRSIITYASVLCLLFAASTVFAEESDTMNPSVSTVQNKKKASSNKQEKNNAQPIPYTAPVHGFAPQSAHSLGLGSRIHVNGFLSAGVAKTNTTANYNIPDHGSINNNINYTANSLVGLQIIGDITRQFSAVVQLVANGDNTNGNQPYHVKAEWAFLRYAATPGLQFRAGRFRLPAFMYSDTEEVGYTYPWVTLPNEVYRIVPFNNMNGFDMIYSLPLGNSGWVLSFQPYVGENQSQYDLYTNDASFIPSGTTATFDENDLLGGVVSMSNQYLTLRANYTRVNLNGYIPNLPSLNNTNLSLFHNVPASFYSVGAKFDYHHFLAVSEYAHRNTPDQLAALTGYYGMVGYRIGKFLPNLTYAHIDTTNTHELITTEGAELPEAQRSYTAGLDYYINSNVVAKVGVSQITPLDGTNGLFDAPVGRQYVYLYSASLDIIF